MVTITARKSGSLVLVGHIDNQGKPRDLFARKLEEQVFGRHHTV